MDLERRQMVSDVLEALGSDKRLATFEQITQGTRGSDIHNQIDASRSGVNHFIDDFQDAGLIGDPEDGRYELTAKGERVENALAELDEDFRQFEVEQLRGMAAESSLSAEEIEAVLQEVKEQKDDA